MASGAALQNPVRQLNCAGPRLSLDRAARFASAHTARALPGGIPHRAGLTPSLARAVTDTALCQERHHGEVSASSGVDDLSAWRAVGEGPGQPSR